MQFQIINLETGDFQVVTLEEAAEIAQLDPHDIAWAVEEHGVCETDIHQITKLPEVPEEECEASDAGDAEIASETEADRDAGDASDADFILPLPVFIFISMAEFEAHLAESPAAVIRLKWDEPIVREAVEADQERVTAWLRGDEDTGEESVGPSGVFHLTREEIALVR